MSGVAIVSTSHLGRIWFESRPGLRLTWQDFHKSLQDNTCFQILAEVINDNNFYSLQGVTQCMPLKWRHYMVSQIHTDIQHTLGHHLVNTCPITRVYVPSFSTMVQHLRQRTISSALWTWRIKESLNRLLMITYKRSCVYTWYTTNNYNSIN